jgi:hypothetical protein
MNDNTTFHHWIFSYDASTNLRTVFRDGILVGSEYGSSKLAVGNQTMRIGGMFWYSDSTNRYFQGALGRVELFANPVTSVAAAKFYQFATLQQVAAYPLEGFNQGAFANSLGGSPCTVPPLVSVLLAVQVSR